MAGFILILICLLGPWQIYLGASGIGSISLVQFALLPLVVILVLHTLLRSQVAGLPMHAPMAWLSIFAFGCLVAGLWSPDPALAVKTSVKLVGILIVALSVATTSERTRSQAVLILGVSAAVLAVAVVLFRLFPILEIGFWLSPVASFTIDPDILVGLRERTVSLNVLSYNRAGGVFSNANSASLFFGLVLFLLLGTRPATFTTTALSAVLLAGVLATGSKTGLVALLVTGPIWIVHRYRSGVTLTRSTAILIGGAIALGVLVPYVLAPETAVATQTSLGSRFTVWRVATLLLAQHPFGGLGFGGWQDWASTILRFEGVETVDPLHNLFLIAWAWMGLAGVALVGAFALSSLAAPWNRARTSGLSDSARVALALVFVWLVIQSMMTNAAIPDIRIGIPVGIAMGVLSRPPQFRLYASRL